MVDIIVNPFLTHGKSKKNKQILSRSVFLETPRPSKVKDVASYNNWAFPEFQYLHL